MYADYSKPWWRNGLEWFGMLFGTVAILVGATFLVHLVVYPAMVELLGPEAFIWVLGLGFLAVFALYLWDGS